MRLEWVLDVEDGIDPADLLGEFKATDSHGASIRDPCVYIESIFTTLSEGLINSASNGVYISELFDKPGSLLFNRSGAELLITYEQGTIKTKYDEAVEEICRSYLDLSIALQPYGGVGIFTDLNENIAKLSTK